MPNIEEIVDQNITSFAPDYENNIRTKFKGYNIVFFFPTCPIPEEKAIAFPAYTKKITDTFTPNFGEGKAVYGRMDPIPVYQNTTRQIVFDLSLPSNGLAHSRDIAKKLNILVKNVYPSYQRNGNVNVISSPPLVSIFFSNLIYDKTTNSSLLGYFKGAIAIAYNLEKGVFSRGEGYETYPKAYDISFTFNVLHQYTPGYVNSGGTITNPVNILQSNR